MRTYRDLCGIARALDVVGERWALLVVRELLHGPKRFADLHRGLPGMSQNVLSQRLRELEASGVLERTRALPPASGFAYALTERGRALDDVLLALGRWGSPIAPAADSPAELSVDALVVALRTTFVSARADGLEATVQLRLPGDAFVLQVAGGQLEVVRGVARGAVVLEADVRVVQDLVFEGRALEDALHVGDASVEGDATALARVLACFDDGRGVGMSEVVEAAP